MLGNNFPTLIQMVNIREGNFNFPMFSISISQSTVQTIGKSEQIGKIKIYIISQEWLTPWCVCVCIYVCINEIIEIMKLYS